MEVGWSIRLCKSECQGFTNFTGCEAWGVLQAKRQPPRGCVASLERSCQQPDSGWSTLQQPAVVAVTTGNALTRQLSIWTLMASIVARVGGLLGCCVEVARLKGLGEVAWLESLLLKLRLVTGSKVHGLAE